MVSPHDLRELKLADPFVPFRLHLTNGTTLEVPDPLLILVCRREAVVGVARPGRRLPIADRFVFVNYESVIRVERIDGTPPGRGT